MSMPPFILEVITNNYEYKCNYVIFIRTVFSLKKPITAKLLKIVRIMS